jgi:hypothetical protein
MIREDVVATVIRLASEYRAAHQARRSEMQSQARHHTSRTPDEEMDAWIEDLQCGEKYQPTEHEEKENERLRQLSLFIEGLDEEDKRDLLSLCWLGRGDFDDYEAAREHAKAPPAIGIGGYLSGKHPLDEYLSAGLERKQRGYRAPEPQDEEQEE